MFAILGHKSHFHAIDYHGPDAEYVKLQALQLLLRLQIQALSKLWSLPDTFEVSFDRALLPLGGADKHQMVVRDVWAYQLAISPLPPVPSDESLKDALQIEPPLRPEDDDKSDDPGDGAADSDYSSSKGESELDIDSEILTELSDGTDGEAGSSFSPVMQRRDTRWRRRRRLRISDTIVTLVLGLWISRIPVMNVDIVV